MRVAQLGNFGPAHSTENDLRRALENNGHDVVTFQEGDQQVLDLLIDEVQDYNFVLWTRTKSLAEQVDINAYWELLANGEFHSVPVVGYHLDRWWGLKRQEEIKRNPFFRVALLCTADGGHQEQWESVPVDHVWYPPAISERWCYLGTPREEYRSDIAFVGSWEGGYHEEDTHRIELIQWLRDNYSNRVKFWPEHGQPRIVGGQLNDLYASTKVVVGTSCLVPNTNGQPMTNYCSDRIPETMGRGGVLLHPYVEGITEVYRHDYWYLDDWTGLGGMIEARLDDESLCRFEREIAVEHIKAEHTYEERMRELVHLLINRGML